MTTRHHRPIITAITLAFAVTTAACGEPTPEAAGAADNTELSTLPAAATTTVTVDEECTSELRTLEVATEAYFAQNGTYPASETELVEVEFIRKESVAYDLLAGTGEIVRVPGVPCPTGDMPADETATAEPKTGEELLATLTEQEIESVGGLECATELSEIVAAGRRFVSREGREPDSLDEFVNDVPVAPVLWTFDAERDALVPAEGSPCIDFLAPPLSPECELETKTLEVAREAYFAVVGANAAEPTEADLLEQNLIREEYSDLDLVDGVVVAVPGGPCDTVPAPSTTSP